MKYSNIFQGSFVKRNNRFSAEVEIDGRIKTVHVKNTGRLKELLTPGAKVWLTCPGTVGRKTEYDLVAVEKTGTDGNIYTVNIDSQIPNAVALEWLKGSTLFSLDAVYKREVKYGNSRFDIYIEDQERKAFIEVKGVTLELDSMAVFPDAPTERGVKHIRELSCAIDEGYEAYVLFIIQMKGVTGFRPNYETHREFAEELEHAHSKGVKILAVDCTVMPDSINADSLIDVILEEKQIWPT